MSGTGGTSASTPAPAQAADSEPLAPPPVRGARSWRRALQTLAVAAILGFATRALAGQWDAVRAQAASLRPNWGGVVGSALLVLATYALLVASWRSLVVAWGDRLGYHDAVRIWAVSNLGRYLPGKVWSIGIMGALARQAGVSPVAAAGSALVGTVVNLAAGGVVLLLTGGDVIAALFPGAPRWRVLLPVAGAAAFVAVPLLIPVAARLAARLTGRAASPVRLPFRTLAVVAAANVAAWLLYGVAFRWLAGALLPGLGGKWQLYVAVFAGSYLAGYLALLVPGGLGVRELSMAAALDRAGGADAGAAAVLAVASRLWLTVLELLPGLYFVARGALRSVPRSRPDAPA